LRILAGMELPSSPVTLTPEQVAELELKLRVMRHDINNHLSLVIASLELIRSKPEMAARMLATLSEQPAKITQAMTKFSREFDQFVGIKRAQPTQASRSSPSPSDL
jgi:aspartokinase